MLNVYKLLFNKYSFAAFTLFLFAACNNSPSDAVIEKNITDSVSAYKNFANVKATVDKGVVSLTGTCDGDGCVAEIEGKLLKIEGVKKVVNELKMSTTDLTLRTSVQSIITKYAGVQADVAAGEVVLRGSIARDLLQPLITELKALNARKIDNQLAILQ